MKHCFVAAKTVLVLGGLLVVSGAGCQGGGGNASAAEGAPAPARSATFDADRAFADLKKQVAFGPRVAGTEGHLKTRDWLLAQLGTSADKAFLQTFEQRLGGVGTLSMSNLVAQFNPDAKKQVLLCAHWDTRPTADMEIEPAKKRQPIPGANDGASGVAVLLEVARRFKVERPAIGVQIVLFDGEDYGPSVDRMFLGARHYAKTPALPKPDYAILIDMIGDKDLQIFREKNSEDQAAEINNKVWNAARALKIEAFQYGVRHEIEDDHIPLQRAGFKIIDLIDFDYAFWHTLDDTPDQCAPASLKAVGDVLAKVIYDEKP